MKLPRSFCVPAGASESVYTPHFIPLQGFFLPLRPTLCFNASCLQGHSLLAGLRTQHRFHVPRNRAAGRAHQPPGRLLSGCREGGGWPVSRVLSPAFARGWPFIWDRGRPRPRAVHPDDGPEAGPGQLPCRPYLTLLPVGLAVPPPSPGARWALTPPFHPCRGGPRRSDLCGAFPGVRGRPLPPPGVTRHRASVEPGLSSLPEGSAAIRPSADLQVRTRPARIKGGRHSRQGQRPARRSRCATPAANGPSPARAGQKRPRNACQTASVGAHQSPLSGAA